ncbi:hypothetical protein Q1J52_02355 [Pseudomonas lijiangensis]|uniref:hypothetical protein n=1 Tax=Pseudomonas syringae group TaxID=136849 RepID=UPI001911116C|nr:hypothetical protein [Pseudomonas cichorii]
MDTRENLAFLITALPTFFLLSFIIISAFDNARRKDAVWGRLKSFMHTAFLGSGSGASIMFIIKICSHETRPTILITYAIAVSILNAYLYSSRLLSIFAYQYAARRERLKNAQDKAHDK